MIRYIFLSLCLSVSALYPGMTKVVSPLSSPTVQKDEHLTQGEIKNFIAVIAALYDAEAACMCEKIVKKASYDTVVDYIMPTNPEIVDSVKNVIADYKKYKSCSLTEATYLNFCTVIKKELEAQKNFKNYNPHLDGIFEIEL